MKRKFGFVVAALCAVIGIGLSHADTAQAAPDTSGGAVTALYYANQGTYPDSSGFAEGVNESGDWFGACTRWDYGAYVFVPNEGYSVASVYYSNEEGTDEHYEISLSTFGQVKPSLVDVPDSLSESVSAIDNSAKAVFVDRMLYQEGWWKGGYLHVIWEDNEENRIDNAYRIRKDELQDRLGSVAIGDTVNLSDCDTVSAFLTANSCVLSDFDLEISANDGFEIAYMNVAEDNTTVTPTINGSYIVKLTKKTDGRIIELNLFTAAPAISEDVEILVCGETVDADENSGYIRYELNLDSVDAQPEADVSVKLPEGVTIDWTKTAYLQTLFVQNGSNVFKQDKNGDGEEETVATINHSVVDGCNIFHVSSVDSIQYPIYVVMNYEGVRFVQIIQFHTSAETGLELNTAAGAQEVYVTPYATYPILKFVRVSGEGLTQEQALAKFLGYLENGRLVLKLAGGELLKDDEGHYTGEVVFYHTGFRFDIDDVLLNTSITGSDLLVVCNSRTAVAAGTSVNIKEMMGNFWRDDYSVAVTGEGFSYEAGIVKTPATVDGDYVTGRAVVKGNVSGEERTIGTYVIDACAATGYDDAIVEIISEELAEGESLVIDAEDSPNQDASKGAIIDRAIINAVASEEGISLQVKANEDNREITWVLDSDELAATNKDLMVDVDVTDVKVDNKNGIELAFKDNGTLPGETTVRIELTDKEAEDLGVSEDGQQIYLQYLNPTTGKYTAEQEHLVVREDPLKDDAFYIEVPVTHNSTFVLTNKATLSDAKNGWVKENKKYYLYKKGVKLYDWQKVGGKWYYLGTDGAMLSDWQKISGKWYYFATSGEMKTGWQKISNKWYYFAASGAMLTGWQKISNKWYYFATSGAMLTGWQKISNKWYYFATSGVMKTGWEKVGTKWYCFATSGEMKTGWLKSGTTWYYLGSGGAMATGWTKVGSAWYYFDANGKMCTGWQKISNKWYYFAKGGAMQTGWITVGGKSYYLYDKGYMATNTWIGKYYVNASGVWTKTKK